MPLPSFFQKKDKAPKRAAVAEDAGPVQEARVRARRRLIGAVVLLAAGIVGFPMLFETKPRPMPVDVPIDLARKDNAAPRPARVQPPPAVVELPADAGNETPAVPSSSSPASSVPAAGPVKVTDAASKPAAASAIKAPVPPPRPSAPIPRNDESVRNDKPSAEARPATPASAEAPAGRFVVQVGAYTDQGALREARQKVEKLGLKTYTQDVDTPSGKRTRLRVGPFATRDQAESAGARLKAIGLPGNLLVL